MRRLRLRAPSSPAPISISFPLSSATFALSSRCSFALVVPTRDRCPRHHRIPRLQRMTALPPSRSACPCPSARGDSIGGRGGTRERNGQRRVCLRYGVIKREEDRPLPLLSSGAKGELKDVSGRTNGMWIDDASVLHRIPFSHCIPFCPPECRNNGIC